MTTKTTMVMSMRSFIRHREEKDSRNQKENEASSSSNVASKKRLPRRPFCERFIGSGRKVVNKTSKSTKSTGGRSAAAAAAATTTVTTARCPQPWYDSKATHEIEEVEVEARHNASAYAAIEHENDDSTAGTIPLGEEEEDDADADCDAPPKEQQLRPSSRTVAFSDTIGRYETLHWKDYTTEERQQTWYTRWEFALIKLHVKTACQLLNSIPALWEENEDDEAILIDCHRGLERRSNDLKDITSKKYIRRRAYTAVHNEVVCQRRQPNSTTNPHRIAEVYRAYSVPALVAAQTIAQHDASYVACGDL